MMKEFKKADKLLSTVRRCCQNYCMLEEGDKIAVGVSGGKDSTVLLCSLAIMRRCYPVKYSIIAVNIDLGTGQDTSSVEKLCRETDVEFVKVRTEIGKIVFELRREGCSLCSRLRRGALHNEAERLECNKVALAHTKNDVTETLLMNLFYSGNMSVFWPKNTADKRNITLIRPMIYTDEKTVKEFCRVNGIVPAENNCPFSKATKRETVRKVLQDIERENRGVTDRIFRAIEKRGTDGFKDSGCGEKG